MWYAALQSSKRNMETSRNLQRKKRKEISREGLCVQEIRRGRGCSQNDNGQCYVNYILMKGLCGLCQNKR